MFTRDETGERRDALQATPTAIPLAHPEIRHVVEGTLSTKSSLIGVQIDRAGHYNEVGRSGDDSDVISLPTHTGTQVSQQSSRRAPKGMLLYASKTKGYL
jgi:hypothetical protein